jgi:hypothetical protein
MINNVVTYFSFGYLVLTLLGCSSPNEGEQPDTATPDQQIPTQSVDEFYYLSVEYKKWQNGVFQPWSTEESAYTLTVDNMNLFTPKSDYATTEWGGRTDLNMVTTAGKDGFFRVAKSNNRYYLLDPDNGAVILHGIQHVRPGSSSVQTNSFNSKFGNETKWATETAKLLSDYSINYISYGSNRIEAFPTAIRTSLLTPNSHKIAYAETLYVLRSFMWDMNKNLGYTFDDDTYNRLILVFEPTFTSYAESLISNAVSLFSGDKHFIGYYLDNELPFASYQNKYPLQGVDINHFLSLPDRYYSARNFAENFLKDKGQSSTSTITEQVQDEFRAAVADYYYKTVCEILRRHDSEHLILGSRLHDWSKYNKGVVEACAKYCDVVSINYYARWQPETDFMSNLKSWCGTKPFIISEFYTKGDDCYYNGAKYSNIEGGGWLVRTQRDRGKFYQNFCLHLLQENNCVGWVHFEYNDEYSSSGNASNKGIVSLEYEPYEVFLSCMRQLNVNTFALIDYFDYKKTKQ